MRPVVVALARRALVNSLRRPQFLAPLVVFPTLFLAINVGGLGATRTLDGFPQVDGFLDYQLAAAILQSLLLGGVSAGIATALDIEGGFFDRLVASPTPRMAIVLGRVLAASVIATFQILYFFVLGYAFGATVQGGVLGMLCVLAIGIVAGTGFGAIGVLIALRSRSASTVQGIFPLVFVVLFISSAFFPLELLVLAGGRHREVQPAVVHRRGHAPADRVLERARADARGPRGRGGRQRSPRSACRSWPCAGS